MSFSKDAVYGNHLGIVINNKDPEERGRVQIWIPYLTNTLHSGWNEELKDKSFKHIHDSGALTPQLVKELTDVLPWAECASPIIGGGTSAVYNPATGKTSTNPFDTLDTSNSSFFSNQGNYSQEELENVAGISLEEISNNPTAGLDDIRFQVLHIKKDTETLKPEVKLRLIALNNLAKDQGISFQVSSTTSKTETAQGIRSHTPNSLHYNDSAFDITYKSPLNSEQVKFLAEEGRNMGFDEIILHSSHIHLGYGRKELKGKNKFTIDETGRFAWFPTFKNDFYNKPAQNATHAGQSVAGTSQSPAGQASNSVNDALSVEGLPTNPDAPTGSSLTEETGSTGIDFETPLPEVPNPQSEEPNVVTTSSDNSVIAPIPGDSIVSDPTLDGDQPSGMISVPMPGAKVFVFFLAGDIQKPVYFANSLEPATMKKLLQTGSSPLLFDAGPVNHRESSILSTRSVKLTLDSTCGIPDGVPEDRSALNLSANGSEIGLNPYKIVVNSSNNYVENAKGDHLQTWGGSGQVIAGANINNTALGDYKITCGKFDKEAIEASAKLKEIVSKIQQEKLEKIKETAKSGEDVPCPLCSTSYAVDRASAFAKRALSFIRRITGQLPWFSYVVDVLSFLLKLILIPLFNIVPGHVLGECGNPDCKNGKIPSPQKPIEEANKEAIKKLSEKQEEIAECEKKLGNGGVFTVTATKGVAIIAGLETNDVDVYAKGLPKESVPTCFQSKTGGKGTGKNVLRLAGPGVDQNVHCECTNLPGDLLLQGGNSVKIVGGSAGIELDTKGALKFNCGSVNLLSSESKMILGSTNHTTIKGKVVTIDANDRSKESGVQINSPQTLIQGGLSVAGDSGFKGGVRIDGELSVNYINAVGQRLQTSSAGSPDSNIPFANWALGPAQANDIINQTRQLFSHYIFPPGPLNLDNFTKIIYQIYNTILLNTIIEPISTGVFFGWCPVGPCAGWIWNWRHNHVEDPKPHHHDFTAIKGVLVDDKSGVESSAVEPNPIPTRPRGNGIGPDGGPRTLAGCGGFGGFGGSTSSGKKFNSFGLPNDIPNFSNVRINDPNIKINIKPDGTPDIVLNNTKC